jgi:8'-apo-carotenoid 13,14-cleaving dioxygenase
MTPASEHPFLSGNYAPVPDETTVTGLPVEGVLPAALSGRYLRIGPNPIGNVAQPYEWTTTDGMVHAVALQAGRAISYRNRWIRTDPTSHKLGTEAVPGPRPPAADASATNVIGFGGRVYSLADGALAYELSPDLDTVRRVDLAGHGQGVGAHPKIDPATGELHLISSPGQLNASHHVISAGGMTRRSRAILHPPAPVHDLLITRDDLVLVSDGITGITALNSDEPITWYTTHTIGPGPVAAAHDHGDSVVMYVTGETLQRWTLGPGTRCAHRVLDATPQSFGRIYDQFPGAAPRYLYATGGGGTMPFDGTVVFKHDLITGTREHHDFGTGRHPGELLFVADPQRRASEDGGWLIGLVHDETTSRTSLVVLDAADLTSRLAAVPLPRRVPYGLHGRWEPSRI